VELNSHGTDDQLEGYLLGQMSTPDIHVFEEHLILCTACRDRLDAMEHFVVGMQEALAEKPAFAGSASLPNEWFAWLRRPAFALAVAFIALVAAVGIFSIGRTKFVPLAALELTAIRGDIPVTVPARELDLTLSDAPRQGGPFRVEVVDAMGRAVWNGTAGPTAAGVQVKTDQRLGPGQYFVRLYSASGQLLHEYGFRIRAA
jgi:hypothetical protein